MLRRSPPCRASTQSAPTWQFLFFAQALHSADAVLVVKQRAFFESEIIGTLRRVEFQRGIGSASSSAASARVGVNQIKTEIIEACLSHNMQSLLGFVNGVNAAEKFHQSWLKGARRR